MQIGQRVSWRSLNLDYTGEVVGFSRGFAVARIDGSGKSVLIGEQENQPTNNNNEQQS